LKIYKKYINVIIVALLVIVLLRVIELAFITFNFGFNFSILGFELIGLALDFVVLGFFLYLWYFIYRYLYKKIPHITDRIFLVGIIVFDVLHLSILKYFLYQLRPLDIFLYSHSLRESLFSYNTSNTSYIDMVLMSIFVSSVVILSFQFFKKQDFSDNSIHRVKRVLLIAFLLFPILEIFGIFSFNNFSINKSFYFYKRSIGYVYKKEKRKFVEYDNKLFKEYQNNFGNKEYLSLEYPLLHKFENSDVLGKFFDKKPVSPNIVFLIVEGMSDEFIHDYKGLKLMPYIDHLSENSLYWKNFFTLGERSFAVVPSITGGLPYADKGFTLQNSLPYHYSLVNILNKNHYYTIYFDSQDAWFHDKDKYFKFDNIDKIFDKNDFSNKYEKILIGKEKYFWGYTDLDLFNQALEVMDTLPREKRMELYFTGTMHSPFAIREKEKYEKLLSEKLAGIKDKETIAFFDIYKKQVLSLVFTDNAIKSFIKSYQLRPEYKNTIFIITGDHPMTEIPPEDGVKKYHVPLIIYSPLLNEHKVFHGISSHLDVYETLLAFLNTNYDIEIPKISTSIGYKLDTSSVKNNNRIYAFMNDNREVVDLYDSGVFLSNQRYLFKVKDGFDISELYNRELKNQFNSVLDNFNDVNSFITSKCSLLPKEEYNQFFGYDILFAKKDTSCYTYSERYHYFIKDAPIINTQMFIDISLEFIPEINEQTSVFYTLSDKSGKIKYRNSFNLAYRHQEHKKIEKISSVDSLYLSIYLDNKALNKIEYCKPKVNVYSYK